MIYQKYGKRLMDLLLGLLGLALASVPLLLAIVAIKFSSPGPALFFQSRVGRHGRVFRIYKLRTMNVDANREVLIQVRHSDSGIFAVGRVLRRFKIDEIPQILNVVRGEMSFVGPRPCLEETFESMPNWARRRLDVRPGITGLAQTRGNIALSWEKRWEQDIHYVEHLSLSLDVKLILKTVLVVLIGEEIFRKVL